VGTNLGDGEISEQKSASIASPFAPEAKLKRRIRRHFGALGFIRDRDGSLKLPGDSKEIVRNLHAVQRADRLKESEQFLARATKKCLPFFAEGSEIDPEKIRLRLVRVASDTFEASMFRLASLTWSVPVSAGFGRRLRYLVWDEGHDRIAGVIALGDPVFNLSVRDHEIGWNSQDRMDRLVNLLDAYVLGAVPPYNMLLGGKAVACLIRSREVYEDFAKSYGDLEGIISGKKKAARLLVVTTTSSMGRSSVYNRLALKNERYLAPVGFTLGWGHFHITDAIFGEMRDLLRLKEDPYATNHQFGDGPNWRLRTIRKALNELGMNESALKHGVKREVFICSLARNAFDILKTGVGEPDLQGLLSTKEISEAAHDRWMMPRSERCPEFKAWKRESILKLLHDRAPVELREVEAG
jgi:hypothetical protein